MMTEESFIKLAKETYAAVKELSSLSSYYEYEKRFDKIWTAYGRATLEESISKVPKDRRKKKL